MPRFPYPVEESGVDETIGTPPNCLLDAMYILENKKRWIRM